METFTDAKKSTAKRCFFWQQRLISPRMRLAGISPAGQEWHARFAAAGGQLCRRGGTGERVAHDADPRLMAAKKANALQHVTRFAVRPGLHREP